MSSLKASGGSPRFAYILGQATRVTPFTRRQPKPMDTENDINLLLIHDNVEEANRVVGLLRTANYRVDPHYAGDAADLSRKVQERNWELAVAQYTAQSVPAKTLLQQMRRVSKDIPVILISDTRDSAVIVEGLKMGAVDVVAMEEDQHLLQVVARTLYDLEQRRQLRYWKRRFSESESRFDSLVMDSRSGIAIIQDGTYVLVNDTFAEFFGYPSHDALTLQPVIDSIARSDQFEFKKYLRPLSGDGSLEPHSLQFAGIGANGAAVPVRAALSQIEFHGEPAIQLLVKRDFMAQPQAAALLAETAVAADSSEIRLNDMMAAINGAIRQSARSGDGALLYYLQIDQYDALRKKLGITATEEGIVQLARFLKQQIGGMSDSFGRIREDAFILVGHSLSAEDSLAWIRNLLATTASQVFDTGSGSFSCTLSVGISTINEASTSADDCLGNCLTAIAALHGDNGGQAGNDARLFEAVHELSSPDMSAAELAIVGRQLASRAMIDLLFQPIISLGGQGSEFYEVHMNIEPGALSESWPVDFSHRLLATDAGRELDRQVIALAARSLERHQLIAPATRLFLSISEASIVDSGFLPWLKTLLDDSALTHRQLVFQLREIDIGRNLGKAAALLDSLQQMQAQAALTDVGLAINPLAIVRKLSVDFVKIDSLLVQKAQKSAEAADNMIALIASLRAEQRQVIVPDIETAAVIPRLWQAKVDYIQGRYIQTPAADMNYDFSDT